MPFDLVADVRCFRGRASGLLERVPDHAVATLAREHRHLHGKLLGRAAVEPSADLGVFAFVVLAHDHHVDVGRRTAGERRSHARKQAHGPQVDVLLKAPADGNQQAPQRHVIGHAREADRAKEDRLRTSGAARARRRASCCRSSRSARSSSRTSSTRSSKPKRRPAASSTRMPSGTTSLPIPSPGITAIRCAISVSAP